VTALSDSLVADLARRLFEARKNRSLARNYLDAGAIFVAVGVDTTMLIQAAMQLLGAFKSVAAASQTPPSGAY
jgi:4-hydroxy-2-oxoheptanedioate aldolase